MKTKASAFFSKEEKDNILAAIMEAENETSGEIRVHLETSSSGNVLDRAAWIFKKIGMHKTEDRNGVLFYLSVNDRKFAVIGDKGINDKVDENFWDKTISILRDHFTSGKYAEGLIEGILMAGTQLKTYFPHRKDDVNELPDEISFSDSE
jgi:uncharacterized membrane protein